MRPAAEFRSARCHIVAALTVTIAGPVSAQDPDAVLRSHGITPTPDGVLEFFGSLRPTPTERLQHELWLERLVDPRFATRQRAACALLGFGHRVMPCLQRALSARHADAELIRSGTAILDELRASSETVLLAALDCMEHQGRRVPPELLVSAAVLTTGVTSRNRLIDLLATPASATQAFDCLRNVKPTDPVETRLVATGARIRLLPFTQRDTLADALTDPTPEVRILAAQAVLTRGRRESLPTLVDLLSADDPAIRARAVLLLDAATGASRGFHAFDAPCTRKPAVAAWRDWLEHEAATAELLLPLRLGDDHLAVVELWASETGSGIARFDLEGRELQRIACDPYDVCVRRDGRIAIAERNAGRVRTFDANGTQLHSWSGLQFPNDVELLPGNNVLVVLGQPGRVVELTPEGETVWSVDGLTTPFDAQRLPDGNTLVADAGNDRVVEFSPAGTVVWSVSVDFPNGVHRASDGMTYVTNYTGGRLLAFRPSGELAWQREVGGTVYSPRFADGAVWCVDSTKRRVLSLSKNGLVREVLRLPNKVHDVEFVVGR